MIPVKSGEDPLSQISGVQEFFGTKTPPNPTISSDDMPALLLAHRLSDAIALVDKTTSGKAVT
jgi:hypothetical protein